MCHEGVEKSDQLLTVIVSFKTCCYEMFGFGNQLVLSVGMRECLCHMVILLSPMTALLLYY